MYRSSHAFLLAAVLLVAVPSAHAQPATHPSGHWEGSVQIPDTELSFEMDLAIDARGELAGTMSVPAQNLKGLPLLQVAVEGTSISFHARRDQTFRGVIAADGQSMSGDFTMSGYTLPFSLTRTGDARIEAPVRNAPVSKELEGTWNGTLDLNGKPLRLVLTMTNRPDGAATGRIVNVDQGGLELPIATIAHQAAGLTLGLEVVGGTYSGTLNDDRTELVGTYTQGPLVAPLTFRRAGYRAP